MSSRGTWRVVAAGSAAVALAVTTAGTASAATVRINPDLDDSAIDARGTALTFRAAAGEVNRVTIVVSAAGSSIRDEGAPLTAGPGCAAVSEHEATCGIPRGALIATLLDGDDTLAVGGLARTHVFGGSGDDTLRHDGEARALLEGGDGADRLASGDLSGATLHGDGGDDVLESASRGGILSGGGGRDVLRGGGGGDRLIDGDGVVMTDGGVTPIDADTIDGGGGSDYLDHSRRSAPMRIDLGRVEGQGSPGEDDSIAGVESASGGDGSDWIAAGGSPGTFRGGGGDDVLIGSPAGDDIDGGRGADSLEGGGGNDSLLDGGYDVADDVLSGGPGNDHLNAASGRDSFDGGPGDDRIGAAEHYPGLPAETVACGAGSDRVEPDHLDLLGRDCERIETFSDHAPELLAQLSLRSPRLALLPFACRPWGKYDCRLGVELRHDGRVVGAGRAALRRKERAKVRVGLDRKFAGRLAAEGAVVVRVRARLHVLRRGKVAEREVVQWSVTLGGAP